MTGMALLLFPGSYLQFEDLQMFSVLAMFKVSTSLLRLSVYFMTACNISRRQVLSLTGDKDYLSTLASQFELQHCTE